AVAKDYIREMRAVQPEGPYQMTGMCEGAHIGFEMVKQLHAAGQKVSLFAVLDAWPVENTRNRLLSEFNDLFRPLRRGLRPMAEMNRTERIEYLRAKSYKYGTRILAKVMGTFREASPESAPPSIPINERFNRRYWPGPDFVPPQIQARITVLKVRKQPYW